MNLYRYTTNGKGVFTEGKEKMPEELVEKILEAKKWLDRPDIDSPSTSYFTPEGAAKYEETLLPLHKEYLENIIKEEFQRKDLGEVLYSDEYQELFIPKEASVLSAVPEDAIDLVEKYGLLSSEALLENPEVLQAVLDSRKGTDWEETTEEFTERVKEKLKDTFWGDAMKGPSVFFNEPDQGRLPDDHPIKKLKTRLIRINLEKLLEDFPDTRIAGTELIPYDPEGPKYQGDKRHKDIDLEKVLENNPYAKHNNR